MILEEVDSASRAILEAHGFDGETFERLRRELADGTLRDRGNVVQGIVDLPLDSDLTQLPAPGEPGFTEAAAAGTEALRGGRIANIVLAGGMATRFGGGVKAIAEALDGRSFLEVKLDENERLARELDAEILVVLMTSFATDAAVREHVAERGLGQPVVVPPDCGPTVAPGRAPLRRCGRQGVALRPGSRRRALVRPFLRHPCRARAPRCRVRRRLERRQPRRAGRPRRRRHAPPRAETVHGRGRREGQRLGWRARRG